MSVMVNGVQQWVFQRVSNAVFVIFGIVLLHTIATDGLTYEALTALFDTTSFKVYAVLTLAFASVNSLLAGWQIVGDYAVKFKLPPFLLMAVIVIVSQVYLIWGCMLLLC